MNEQLRYTRIAMILHWMIAFFIVTNLATGLLWENIIPPLKLMHVSAGITILLLTLVRVLWRLTHQPPPLSASLTQFERRLAGLVHRLFYILMLALPLSGWAMISANPPHFKGPPLWGLVPLPLFEALHKIGMTSSGLVRQKMLHDDLLTVHMFGAYILIGLLILHVMGALKHQFVDGGAQFSRMGIGR